MKRLGILDQGRQAGAGVIAFCVAIAIRKSRGLVAVALDRCIMSLLGDWMLVVIGFVMTGPGFDSMRMTFSVDSIAPSPLSGSQA